MNSRPYALGALALVVVLTPVAKAQRLAEKSPFLPPAAKDVPVVTENAPLELRGIMGEGAGRMFNVYNPSTKMSSWLSINEAGQNFSVRSFDESADTISVEYGGRNVVLKLAQAKIAAIPEARPGPQQPAVMPAQPAVAPRQPTPEQVRALENVTAEVERRRALRNQAIRPQTP